MHVHKHRRTPASVCGQISAVPFPLGAASRGFRFRLWVAGPLPLAHQPDPSRTHDELERQREARVCPVVITLVAAIFAIIGIIGSFVDDCRLIVFFEVPSSSSLKLAFLSAALRLVRRARTSPPASSIFCDQHVCVNEPRSPNVGAA
eukprot:CAMPEP_0119531858 /NCGR_PEP_ID=MMETSP1344-20130328/45481_1 /TAXON_ID=236787 /ORGANISM="Florenciella parvula, Strain CCMP2471" /LENGTH=146 /DNA_ID=CAMNT_0007572211 /DNA_START=314 /DNA_END=751 /DNA_ORIENTATION=-